MGKGGLGFSGGRQRESLLVFSPFFFLVSAKDGEEFIAQLKALTNRKDQIKSLVESYDFRDNSLGLPIDAFIFGDYSRYIDALRIHQADQFFFTDGARYQGLLLHPPRSLSLV